MTTTGTEPSILRWRALRPLRSREYRLLVAALALSLFATGMWTIVMILQVLAVSDSVTALSGVVACLSAGLFAFSLVGGVAADRFSRRSILIVVLLVDTVVVTGVAVLALTDTIALWQLAVASGAVGSGIAFFYPAYTAYLPLVLPGEELLAANGLEGALRPTMQQALGPALGGLVVGTFLPGIGAVVVAALFGAALLLTLLLRPLPAVGAAAAGGAGDGERPGFFADLRAGVSFVVRTRWLLWTLLFASLLALIIMGPIEVLLPYTAERVFDDGGRTIGFLLTSFGVGGAVGSLAVSSWRLPRRYLTAMVLSWGAGTIPLAVLGYTESFWLMAAALFLVGFTSGAGMVIWGTLLQRRVPPQMMGRVASLDFFVSIALMPLSIALAGPISSVVPIPMLFLTAGTVPVLIAALAIVAGDMPRDEISHPLDVSADGDDPGGQGVAVLPTP